MNEPPTEQDLLALEQHAAWSARLVSEIRRLRAELVRLRSDDWLERAAEEIAEIGVRVWAEWAETSDEREARTLAILRKHRDGKA